MAGKWENPNIPHEGWECIDIEDLGSRVTVCQMCEKETIRYAHYMRHSDCQGLLIVGCVCAGRMEGNLQDAQRRDAFMKSRMNKRKNWLGRKWKVSQKGNHYIKSDGFVVVMKQKKNGVWFAFVQSEDGSFKKWSSQKNANENKMKLAAFDCLTNVLAEKEIAAPHPEYMLAEKVPQKTLKAEPNYQADIKIIPDPVAVPQINAGKDFMQGELFQVPAPVKNNLSAIKSEPRLSDGMTVVNPAPGSTKGRSKSTLSETPLFNETALSQMGFTGEQENIFKFIKNGTGHGIIDAVAGAGKTTTIMECARYVENKTDVLFCAFNKSIQSEIAGKFNKQMMNQITVKTIHALGFQILKDNNSASKKFIPKESKYRTILNSDPDMQEEIQVYIDELMRINGYDLNKIENPKNTAFAIKDMAYKFKERLLDMNQKIRATLTPNDFEKFKDLVEHFGFFTVAETGSRHFHRELEIYFETGKILLEAGNALAKEALVIDYTDMLYLPFVWNLRASRTYSFLFIDECQDLSKSQLAVVLKYGQKDGRILAVGDPYQSIYGFAGADIESFGRIRKMINASPLPLTTCFRCPPNVVALAAGIRKDISASKQEPGIIMEINIKKVVKMAEPDDLIISRYREPILFLIFEFINRNMQVQIHRDEVSSIINELKSLFKQEERAALIEEAAGNFEEIKQAAFNRCIFIIEREARKVENMAERQVFIKTKTDYLNNRLEFMHKKYLQWKTSCRTINDILCRIKDFISAGDNCIKLSTIHRAKGLEARRVFILNFDDLPHVKPNQKPWEIIQEQNLKYVAITRALDELYLVKSEKTEVIKKEANLFDEYVSNINDF